MEDPVAVEVNTEDPTVEVSENFSENLDNVDEENAPNIDNNMENQTENTVEDVPEENNESESTEEVNEEENNELVEKFSALEKDFNELKENYESLKSDYDVLVEFKRTVDNEKKDALIAEFYMLSKEDKKEIIENKENYSLEEIKAKLSVICFDKKISFSKEKEEETVTYTLEDTDKNSNLPDWVKAVK